MSKIVAEQLVDMLVEAGVKRVYAVTGDSLNHFNDAIRRNGKIKWIIFLKFIIRSYNIGYGLLS